MNKIIPVDFTQSSDTIQLDQVRESRALRFATIEPADSPDTREVAVDRAATPIKRIQDIERISDYLIRRGQYRDNMLQRGTRQMTPRSSG